MRPRIILRTHYQANEPRIVISTVTRCSGPTESRKEETIAACLVRWAKTNAFTLSLPGAVYATGNAKSLGLLNASHRWTAEGLAFAYIDAKSARMKELDSVHLSEFEKRLYLRRYLEAGGAMLIQFGHWLLPRGFVFDDDLRKEAVIEKLLADILEQYLKMASEIRDRTSIRRERDRLRSSQYASSTKRHKRYPLLTTMERLNLAQIEVKSAQRVRISPDANGNLASILGLIPDVAALERFCRDQSLSQIIDDAGYEDSNFRRCAEQDLVALVASGYQFAMSHGLQACPLGYLEDVLFALTTTGTRLGYSGAENYFNSLRERFPSDVRFHVDRRGRRAFVLADGSALRELELLARRSSIMRNPLRAT